SPSRSWRHPRTSPSGQQFPARVAATQRIDKDRMLHLSDPRRNNLARTREGSAMAQANRDKPWLFRTYAGHSTAAKSNALYRANLARGQTGLSVAFDLPTQTGYDSDHDLARGEVGKVGVPVCHLGDMRALFADLPPEAMN